jgi:hypothetical protein
MAPWTALEAPMRDGGPAAVRPPVSARARRCQALPSPRRRRSARGQRREEADSDAVRPWEEEEEEEDEEVDNAANEATGGGVGGGSSPSGGGLPTGRGAGAAAGGGAPRRHHFEYPPEGDVAQIGAASGAGRSGAAVVLGPATGEPWALGRPVVRVLWDGTADFGVVPLPDGAGPGEAAGGAPASAVESGRGSAAASGAAATGPGQGRGAPPAQEEGGNCSVQ